MSQRTIKTWGTGDATISNTYRNNRRVGWSYDADGRSTSMDGYYAYDAAGRNNYLAVSGPTLPTATLTHDGNGQQIKSIETWVDETFETQSETKYYVRSTVLGGQLLAEVATIRLHNQFFDENVGGLTNGGDERVFSRNPTTSEAQIMVLLHELRHATTGIPHPSDGTVKDSSTDFYSKIFDYCIK